MNLYVIYSDSVPIRLRFFLRQCRRYGQEQDSGNYKTGSDKLTCCRRTLIKKKMKGPSGLSG